jgi:hypothetical protein
LGWKNIFRPSRNFREKFRILGVRERFTLTHTQNSGFLPSKTVEPVFESYNPKYKNGLLKRNRLDVRKWLNFTNSFSRCNQKLPQALPLRELLV